MVQPKFHSTTAIAQATGFSRASIWRACSKHPGFAVRLGAQFRVPDDHLRRVIAGERIEDIAAEARSVGANRAA